MLGCSYRHFSSRTLITGLMPFELSLGVGAAAKEPSPKNNAWSSHLDNCAASRMVNGRTRTVTEMEDAPSWAMVALKRGAEKVSRDTAQALAVQNAEAQSEGVSLRLVVLDDDVALSESQCFGWTVRQQHTAHAHRQGLLDGNQRDPERQARDLTVRPQLPTLRRTISCMPAPIFLLSLLYRIGLIATVCHHLCSSVAPWNLPKTILLSLGNERAITSILGFLVQCIACTSATNHTGQE
jgi:hypothetical protein